MLTTLQTLILTLPVAAQPCGPDPAQLAEVPATSTPRLAPAASEGFGLVETESGAFAAGRGWKATFDGPSVTFVPALGEAAPFNHSVSFELTAAGRVDGSTLAVDRGTRPEVRGDAVELARAVGFVERWLVSTEGLEQTYLFDARPAGDGDLVVAGRLSSSLPRPATGRYHGGLTFVDPALGGVRLSGVTGIDADGRRSDGWLELDGDELRLVLPDAFVDEARFPLVVDPVWSATSTVPGLTGDQSRHPRAVWSENEGVFAVAYDIAYSAADSDVYVRFLNFGGVQFGSLAFVEFGFDLAREPRIVARAVENGFVVTYERSASALAPTTVEGAAVEIDGSVGPKAELLAPLDYPHDHDIVEIDNQFYDQIHVTWTDGAGGVFGRRFFFQEPAGPLEPSAALESLAPAPEGEALLWSRHQTVAAATSLVAFGYYMLIEHGYADRTELRAVFSAPSAFFGEYEETLVADVSGTGGASLEPDGILVPSFSLGLSDIVVAHRVPEPGGTDWDVVLASTTPGGSTVVTDTAGAVAGLDEGRPALAVIDDEAVLIYARESAPAIVPGLAPYDLVYRSHSVDVVHPIYGPGIKSLPWSLAEPEQTVAGAPWIARTSLVGRDIGDQGLFAVQTSTTGFPPTSAVETAGFETEGPGGTVTDFGGGCGGGGTLTAQGAVSVGNDDFRLEVTGLAPQVAVSVFNLNTAQATLDCGGCKAMPWLIYQVQPAVLGESSWDVPIVDSPTLVGAKLGVQVSSFYSTTENCALLPFAAWSNLLELEFGL